MPPWRAALNTSGAREHEGGARQLRDEVCGDQEAKPELAIMHKNIITPPARPPRQVHAVGG